MVEASSFLPTSFGPLAPKLCFQAHDRELAHCVQEGRELWAWRLRLNQGFIEVKQNMWPWYVSNTYNLQAIHRVPWVNGVCSWYSISESNLCSSSFTAMISSLISFNLVLKVGSWPQVPCLFLSFLFLTLPIFALIWERNCSWCGQISRVSPGAKANVIFLKIAFLFLFFLFFGGEG